MFDVLIIGLHMASIHLPAKDGQNNTNVGGYICEAEGLCIGGYRNTLSRNSFYISQRIAAGPIDVHPGFVSGYQKKCTEGYRKNGETVTVTHVGSTTITATSPILERSDICRGHTKGAITPMVTFSYAVPFKIFGVTPRIFYVPAVEKSGSHVLNIAGEF
jgi:hypothetical protein